MKEEYVEQTFQVVSKDPIPLFFNEHLSKVYDNQLHFGIQLPINVHPEKSTCTNGYPFLHANRVCFLYYSLLFVIPESDTSISFKDILAIISFRYI